MNKEKLFIKPKAMIIEFLKDDIIVTSGERPWWGDVGDTTDTEVP